jgi:hypothetical protein
MSQLSRGVFAAIAVLLTCGVVQFALGRDLSRGPQDIASAPETATNINITNIDINRAAKADRAAGMLGRPVQTQTISLRLDVLSDTSVLIRIPVAQARKSPSAPAVTKSGERKMAVACEPVVSILTEVAKQLQPGRCVT